MNAYKRLTITRIEETISSGRTCPSLKRYDVDISLVKRKKVGKPHTCWSGRRCANGWSRRGGVRNTRVGLFITRVTTNRQTRTFAFPAVGSTLAAIAVRIIDPAFTITPISTDFLSAQMHRRPLKRYHLPSVKVQAVTGPTNISCR